MKDLNKWRAIAFSQSENSEKKKGLGLGVGVEFKNCGDILNILIV